MVAQGFAGSVFRMALIVAAVSLTIALLCVWDRMLGGKNKPQANFNRLPAHVSAPPTETETSHSPSGILPILFLLTISGVVIALIK